MAATIEKATMTTRILRKPMIIGRLTCFLIPTTRRIARQSKSQKGNKPPLVTVATAMGDGGAGGDGAARCDVIEIEQRWARI